ncbi:TolC family protein [Riemerella columbina]|uniref:TolC family protein n=1 Tax=Riemerella columbina TaxID=103810 RepID=UPI00266FCB3B|nr:TolC family protein [Riemerella columbina]WKS96026.1 TolC family protein [Riemerella columbina]
MKKNLTLLFASAFILGFSQKKWSLQECIDHANQNNLQVIANQYNKKLQEYNWQAAKNEHLPSVSANMGNTLNFGQTQGFQGSIGRNDNFNNSASVAANVVLYNGGRLSKMVRKSQYDVEASIYDLETVKNNISLQILQQYLSVLLSKEVLKINQSALENAQKLYERAKITTEVGTTAQTVLAEAEAALAREKQNYKNAEINIKRNLFALAQTLQLKDYQNFDVEMILLQDQIQSNETPQIESIVARSYAQQPQIKAYENRLKAAEAQTEVAKTAFLPSVTASASLSSFYFNSLATDVTGVDASGNSINEKGFFEQYKTNFSQQLGVSVNIPIFNKGNTKLQVEQAKVNEEVAKNNLAIQKQELLQNIQKAIFDLEANYENHLSALEAEKSSKLALDFAEKSYAAGRATIYDLNTARNNYATAQGTTAQTKYNFIFSLKMLDFYKDGKIEAF